MLFFKRIWTDRCVEVAFCVAIERGKSDAGIVVALGIANQHFITVSSVISTGGVVSETKRAGGRVVVTSGVVEQRPGASGGIWSPVLKRSVPAPMAVLSWPGVSLASE